jgi:hypothetical protein
MTVRGRKRVERERGDCLVFKLAALALPINASLYNQNPSMQKHSQCRRDSAATVRYLWENDLRLSERTFINSAENLRNVIVKNKDKAWNDYAWKNEVWNDYALNGYAWNVYARNHWNDT